MTRVDAYWYAKSHVEYLIIHTSSDAWLCAMKPKVVNESEVHIYNILKLNMLGYVQ